MGFTLFFINSLHNSGKYDIYITGSNAFLMCSDLATLFTGRYKEFHVFPFSFKEYCEYYNLDGTEPDSLDEYLTKGGLSGSYVYKESSLATDYIHNIYDAIIKRDLVDKYKIGDISIFESLSEFLMDNISNVMVSNKINTNHVTIGNYIKHLCNAFIFYKVKRYDIKGKKIYIQVSDNISDENTLIRELAPMKSI